MRLIDADKLKQNVLDWEDCYNGFSDTYDKARIIGEIEEQPTIDAETVRHGKWIYKEYEKPKGRGTGIYVCSKCGYVAWNEKSCHYCYNCGALMEAKDEDY